MSRAVKRNKENCIEYPHPSREVTSSKFYFHKGVWALNRGTSRTEQSRTCFKHRHIWELCTVTSFQENCLTNESMVKAKQR